MACPDGTSGGIYLFADDTCLDDVFKSQVFLSWTIIYGISSLLHLSLSLYVYFQGQIFKSVVVLSSTGMHFALFIVQLAFYIQFASVIQSMALAVFAFFGVLSVMRVSDEWTGMLLRSVKLDSGDQGRSNIYWLFVSIWWIPMLMLWIFAEKKLRYLDDFPITYNLGMALGMFWIGISAFVLAFINTLACWQFSSFLRGTITTQQSMYGGGNADGIISVRKGIIRYAVLQGIILYGGGIACSLCGIVIFAVGNFPDFFYIYEFVINPLAFGISLPILYVFTRTAKRKSRHGTGTGSALLFGGCLSRCGIRESSAPSSRAESGSRDPPVPDKPRDLIELINGPSNI
jgi:hypothetical protein